MGSTYIEPARLALPVLDRLDAMVAGLTEQSDPGHIIRVGVAALYVDRLPACRAALWRAVEHGRAGGAITAGIEALLLLGCDALLAGEWDEVTRLADEAIALCEKHNYELLSYLLLFQHALIAAARGDEATMTALTDQMIQWAGICAGAGSFSTTRTTPRPLAALGRADYETAFEQVTAISPAGTLVPHAAHALWVILDLVEAAGRTGRHAEAAAHVATAQAAGIDRISPRLALVVTAAAALVASQPEDGKLFEAALAVPGADRWPFELARVHLAYGERLRRAKAPAWHAASSPPRATSSTAWALSRGRSGPARAAGHRSAVDSRGCRAIDRRTHATAARDRFARRGRTHQQADRRPALPVAADGRNSSLPALPEARRHLACRAP